MAQPNIYKFRSREEIEAIIQAEVNKGNTFPVVLPRWKKSFLPKAEIIRAAWDYGYSVFPEGGWGIFYAVHDYFHALGFEVEDTDKV